MKLLVIHGQYEKAEKELRFKHVVAAASLGTKIEFEEIKGDVFRFTRNADNEMLIMMAGPQVVEKAKEAQASGYDAVIPYGTLDIGVDAARYQVDIPVVGMGRSGFCLAANIATRIAVFVYQRTMIPNTRKFIREIGMTNFVTSIRAIDIPLGEMTDQREVLKKRLIKLGKQVILDEDAEIILPRGVTMVPNHLSAKELSLKVGVPVIDCVAASIKTAEMLVNMGIRNSRKAYPNPSLVKGGILL